jgi:hypothetical protein
MFLCVCSVDEGLTNSVKQNPSWETNRRSAGKEIPRLNVELSLYFTMFVRGRYYI